MGLDSADLSYIIISGDVENTSTYLYSRNSYMIYELDSFINNINETSIFVVNYGDNNMMRSDINHIKNHYKSNDIIVKYRGDLSAKKVIDNKELPLKTLFYNTDSEIKTYIHEGISFSFEKQPQYITPLSKEQLKNNMIIEYLYENKWVSKEIKNLEEEYSNYALLMKYNKIRILQD